MTALGEFFKALRVGRDICIHTTDSHQIEGQKATKHCKAISLQFKNKDINKRKMINK